MTSYEDQGSGYDPGAAGHERQGRASPDRRTETWAAADIERMRRVLNLIAHAPGAREWMGAILHDAALELGAKQ